MLAVCTVVIINMLAKALFLLTPKAAMMPSVIRTRQATRAVVDGTRHEADENRADHDIPGFGSNTRQNVQRDPLVEAGRRHRGCKKQCRCHQHEGGVGKTAERQREAGARAHQHFRVRRVGRKTEQECHQCGDDDGGHRIVERFGHPDDDRKHQDGEHAMACEGQALGRG
jgi:hypothetical protein